MAYSTEQVRAIGIQAYLDGKDVGSICDLLRVGRSTVYSWIEKYNTTKSVARSANPGSGRPKKLSGKEINSIVAMIKKPADTFGFDTSLWTIRRIITAVKKTYKLKLSKSTLHRILCDKEQSYKKPETRYYEANKEMQNEWLKKTIPKIKKCIKANKAILYFEDEANVSLACATGKTWGPIGQKTIIQTTGNRGGISAISAISKNSNLIFKLHENKITKIEVIDFLKQMLAYHSKRHLVVVMDQAPPHTAAATKEFINSQARLHVFYLPPRSPEFNADEKIWNHLKNQELCAHQAKNKHELKTITHAKLKKMSSQPALLKGIFMRCEIAGLF